MPFHIVRQDITKMAVDAIVNAANTDLQMGGGVCGAIFNAAGVKEMQDACNAAAPIKTGSAAITPGFALAAKYVIHAAGPVYSQWNAKQNEAYLRSAYTEAMQLAGEYKCESIAFPLISSGIYGYPKDMALAVATSVIRDYLEEHDMDVFLAVFDRKSFQISTGISGFVESYIDEHYVETHEVRRRQLYNDEGKTLNRMGFLQASSCSPKRADAGVGDLLDNLDEPICDSILKLIDKSGKTDVEIYKKANIDRKLFSKIRSGKGYMPGKRTIIALSVALHLSLEETGSLLEKGGYALSHSQKFDVIIEYFITNGIYDIFEINEVLFKYDQPLLGS